MKAYLEKLSKDEKMKKEFETSVNNAISDIAKKHGFDSVLDDAKDYSNSSPDPLTWTLSIGNTWLVCCI
ncbi:MAG: hypothetical protein AAGA77_23655 [Bacteroidota bacterium]